MICFEVIFNSKLQVQIYVRAYRELNCEGYSSLCPGPEQHTMFLMLSSPGMKQQEKQFTLCKIGFQHGKCITIHL